MRTFVTAKKQTPALARGPARPHPAARTALSHADRDQIAHILRHTSIQAKLAISEPGDVYEQEADRVADQVMQLPVTHLEGQSPAAEIKLLQSPYDSAELPAFRQIPAELEEPEEELVQTKTAPGGDLEASYPLESSLTNLRGQGQPLPEPSRAFFEPRFQADLSQVRLHTAPRATELAQHIKARAFTLGSNIVFAPGEYSPETTEGQRLLAHELVHVAQQNRLLTRASLFRQTPAATPTPSPAQNARRAINDFRKRSSPQAFPKLTRNTVADELEQRVSNPSLINQSGLPVCGPAAFAYAWATRDILAFINFAIALFEYGKANLGSLEIAPDDDLKSRFPGSYSWQAGLKPAEADWMVLSSIRDSENSVIDFEGGPSEGTAGGTAEGDIIDWLRELGFRKVQDDVDRVFGDDVDDAKKVNEDVKHKNFIFLCVDAHMIDSGMEKKGIGNHWVVLVGSFTFAKGTVSFLCWTWGSYRNVSVSEKTFNNTYYGAIIASD